MHHPVVAQTIRLAVMETPFEVFRETLAPECYKNITSGLRFEEERATQNKQKRPYDPSRRGKTGTASSGERLHALPTTQWDHRATLLQIDDNPMRFM